MGVDHPGATPDVAFAYDAAGNRTSMSDGAGTQTRTYDAAGRLSGVTRGSDTISYTYDPAANLATRRLPGGATTTYTYDDASRLASVSAPGSATTYAYDAASQLLSATHANGTSEARTYDRAGWVQAVEHRRGATTLWRADYSRDPVGNPTAVISAGVAGSASESFAYDDVDRLVEACAAAPCAPGAPGLSRFAYDEVGNRTSATVGNATTTSTYDADDRLVSSTGPGGTTAYAHDANGRMTTAGAATYAYDGAQRLTAATVGATTWTHAYGGDDQRLSVSSGPLAADTTKTLWDPSFPHSQPVLERNGAGTTLASYTYGLERLAITAGGATSTYHHDALGSVLGLTSSSGTEQRSYTYEAFGQSRSALQHSPSAPANDFRFTGEHLDPNGLYHLRARQYHPGLGRFTATDPLDALLGDPYVSAYVYVNNRPTVMVDPSGMRGEHENCASGMESTTITPTTRGAYLGEPLGTTCVVRTPEGAGAGLRLLAEGFGFVPIVGDFVDGTLCAYDLTLGEKGDSLFSCLAMIPVVGGAATGAKWASKLNELLPSTAGRVSGQVGDSVTVLPSSGKTFVGTPQGKVFDIPNGWTSRAADNDRGIVFQRPGATRNADMIRIMEPTALYPNGHVVHYNEVGQPLDINGRPGPRSSTHIPQSYRGLWPGWPR